MIFCEIDGRIDVEVMGEIHEFHAGNLLLDGIRAIILQVDVDRVGERLFLFVGKEADDPEGQMWHINFAFSGDDQTVESSTYLSMHGKYVEIRDDYYELEGLDDFLKAVDNDMFSYLLNNPEAKKIDPSY